MLVEEQQLKAVVKLPSGVFNPYAGVSTAILFFTKTNSGGTDNVWFYDVQANGMSLDYKRTPCWRRTSSARCRPVSSTRAITRRTTCRTAQSGGRTGSAQSCSASGPTRASASPRPTSSPSKEAVHNETEHRDPGEIIADLEKLEVDIERGLELQARFARRVEADQVSRAFITLAMRSSIPCSRLCNRGRFLGGLTWRGACGRGFSRRPVEAEVHRLGGNDESFHR